MPYAMGRYKLPWYRIGQCLMVTVSSDGPRGLRECKSKNILLPRYLT